MRGRYRGNHENDAARWFNAEKSFERLEKTAHGRLQRCRRAD